MTALRIAAICAAVSLTAATASLADPLLTQPEIDTAATQIEACVAKQVTDNGDGLTCIGTVKRPCDDAISAGGDAAHATCSDNETAAWNVVLDKTWTALQAQYKGERLKVLKNIHQLWIYYRDAKCAFLNDKNAPSPAGIMRAADCLLDETAGRTLELMDLEE